MQTVSVARGMWDRPEGKPVHFIILLILVILSVPCALFTLFQLSTQRALYAQMGNHVIIVLIVSNGLQTLIEMPMHLSFWYLGIVWPPSLTYCYIWSFMEYFMFTANALLMVWASIERHLLVFNVHIFNSFGKRLWCHYAPILFCFLYPMAYYTIFLFFYPCDSHYDVVSGNCITGCFVWTSAAMNVYEQTLHGFVPTLLIAALSISLLVRVLWKKRRLTRAFNWRKNRKMTIQLLSISFLFFFANIGFYTINIVQKMGYTSFASDLFTWAYLMALCLPPVIPFVSLACLPELWTRMNCFRLVRRHNRIEVINGASSMIRKPDALQSKRSTHR